MSRSHADDDYGWMCAACLSGACGDDQDACTNVRCTCCGSGLPP